MVAITNIEDRIELLKRQSLCLRQEEVAVDCCGEIPGSVPGEGALWLEGAYKGWPSKRDDEVEAPAYMIWLASAS